MAKQKGPVHLRGKIGEIVYKATKNGDRAEAAGKFTEKQKKEIGQRPQNRRTPILNKLGSGILSAAKYYSDPLVSSTFFTDMLSRFWEEATDHRVLLLAKLRGMEANNNYLFYNMCPVPAVKLSVSETAYTVEVEIAHPAHGEKGCNSFYLEFILMVWNRDDDHCKYLDASTDWMSVRDKEEKLATIEFDRKPDDTEYLLACRYVGGVNNFEADWTATAMFFMTSGTVTEEGRKILEDRKAALEAAKNSPPVVPEVREKKRVAVRRRGDGESQR